MGAGYLDGRDSRKTATRDIVEKESADLGDQLSLVESSRAIKNIFKGRMRAGQIFFLKSSHHAGLNGQNRTLGVWKLTKGIDQIKKCLFIVKSLTFRKEK